MDKILVTIGGIFTIGFIYWFFFGKKSSFAEVIDPEAQTRRATEGQGMITVIVDGGYRPEIIKVKKGQKTTKITLLRKDENSCLEEFILPDFKIRKYLPLGKLVEIQIKPDKDGEYPFHCGMNMFHGKIIVE